MNNYDNFFLVSDLDGTLINSEHFISRENLEAIQYFIEHGGSFAVATGRTKDNIRPYIKNLLINSPCVLYNGAALYDFEQEKFLETDFMDKHLLDKYVTFCMSTFQNMVVEIFTPEVMYIITPPEKNVDPHVLREKQAFEYSTLDKVIKMNWIKILLYDTHENLQGAQNALSDFGQTNQVDSVFSQSFYLELLRKGVSKGSALNSLKKLPQYQDKFVVAVGDYDNDIEMIKAADIGIAMDNANDRVKQAADKITVSNDDNAICDIIYNVLPDLSDDYRR